MLQNQDAACSPCADKGGAHDAAVETLNEVLLPAMKEWGTSLGLAS